MSIFCSLIRECNIFRSQSTVKTLESASQLPYRHTAKLLRSPEKIKEDEYSIVADLHRISEEFSKPNFGDQIEYAPTQFLCEYIKRLGFDGIKFKSAVSATGTNVLLFDVDAKTRVYDITGSKVYTVNTLSLKVLRGWMILQFIRQFERL